MLAMIYLLINIIIFTTTNTRSMKDGTVHNMGVFANYCDRLSNMSTVNIIAWLWWLNVTMREIENIERIGEQ